MIAVNDLGGITHLVSEDAISVGRQSGRYIARCGAEIIAASLSEPDRGRCGACYRRERR